MQKLIISSCLTPRHGNANHLSEKDGQALFGVEHDLVLLGPREARLGAGVEGEQLNELDDADGDVAKRLLQRVAQTARVVDLGGSQSQSLLKTV